MTNFIKAEDVELINKRARIEVGDVLFASTGTGTVGRMAVVEEYNNDWSVSETMYCLKPKAEKVRPLYLMHILYSGEIVGQYSPKISKGSVPHLKTVDLLNLLIPVPNLKRQDEVVDIIDKFNNYCNSIIDGLPAEIEARHKQYVYYRDKLLTFKEKTA